MSDRPQLVAERVPPKPPVAATPGHWIRPLAIASTLLVLAFALPLYRWVRFGLGSSVFSHVLLIPFVSAYLAWITKAGQPIASARRSTGLAVGLVIAAACVLGAYFGLTFGGPLPEQDALALQILAFVLGFGAICAWKLPTNTLRAYAFPLGFLILMVPFPAFVQSALETGLQHGSADAAYGMLRAAGTPVLRDGLVFHIPGISLEVAPQCSGIRSTLALFVTSIVAGYIFLRSPWKRLLLTVFVIPLAILRNGFRVFTIAELCVHFGPEMVHTPIHHQGGPIFFALSLIPFTLLLWWLRRKELKHPR